MDSSGRLRPSGGYIGEIGAVYGKALKGIEMQIKKCGLLLAVAGLCGPLMGCAGRDTSTPVPHEARQYSQLYERDKDYNALKWLETNFLRERMSRKTVESLLGKGDGPWPEDETLSPTIRAFATVAHTSQFDGGGLPLAFYERTGLYLGFEDLPNEEHRQHRLLIHYVDGKVDHWEWDPDWAAIRSIYSSE